MGTCLLHAGMYALLALAVVLTVGAVGEVAARVWRWIRNND